MYFKYMEKATIRASNDNATSDVDIPMKKTRLVSLDVFRG